MKEIKKYIKEYIKEYTEAQNKSDPRNDPRYKVSKQEEIRHKKQVKENEKKTTLF